MRTVKVNYDALVQILSALSYKELHTIPEHITYKYDNPADILVDEVNAQVDQYNYVMGKFGKIVL